MEAQLEYIYTECIVGWEAEQNLREKKKGGRRKSQIYLASPPSLLHPPSSNQHNRNIFVNFTTLILAKKGRRRKDLWWPPFHYFHCTTFFFILKLQGIISLFSLYFPPPSFFASIFIIFATDDPFPSTMPFPTFFLPAATGSLFLFLLRHFLDTQKS